VTCSVWSQKFVSQKHVIALERSPRRRIGHEVAVRLAAAVARSPAVLEAQAAPGDLADRNPAPSI
jgi:hypothetical protein